MKYKEWLEKQNSPIDPSFGNPIYCPCCHKLIGHDTDYMFMVIMTPIVCPDCEEIVIFPNGGVTFTATNTSPITI